LFYSETLSREKSLPPVAILRRITLRKGRTDYNERHFALAGVAKLTASLLFNVCIARDIAAHCFEVRFLVGEFLDVGSGLVPIVGKLTTLDCASNCRVNEIRCDYQAAQEKKASTTLKQNSHEP
jgi:hypothetical protein